MNLIIMNANSCRALNRKELNLVQKLFKQITVKLRFRKTVGISGLTEKHSVIIERFVCRMNDLLILRDRSCNISFICGILQLQK